MLTVVRAHSVSLFVVYIYRVKYFVALWLVTEYFYSVKGQQLKEGKLLVWDSACGRR